MPIANKIREHKAFQRFPVLKKIIKFSSASGIATLVDFTLFTTLFYKIFELFYAEITSAFIGMIVNFFLQKNFVFSNKRKTLPAFLLSISFSIGIMLFGAYVITLLVQIPLFSKYVILAKITIIGFKFFLNFFTKRWIFEKRFK